MKGHIQTQSYVLFPISEMDLSLNLSCLCSQLSQLAYEMNHISDIKIRSSAKVGMMWGLKEADLGCRNSQVHLGI